MRNPSLGLPVEPVRQGARPASDSERVGKGAQRSRRAPRASGEAGARLAPRELSSLPADGSRKSRDPGRVSYGNTLSSRGVDFHQAQAGVEP